MDITVRKGDKAKLFLEYKNSEPEIKFNGDTLEIIQTSKKQNPFKHASNSCIVELTVPDKKVYNLNVETNVSDINVGDTILQIIIHFGLKYTCPPLIFALYPYLSVSCKKSAAAI